MTHPFRHFSMLRGVHAADLVTLLNACCGVGAILLLQGAPPPVEPWRAGVAMLLLVVALAADIADGAVARHRGTHSVFGREMDSLSDVISFGVAPAVLGHALGLNALLDLPFLLFFVACGIARLARFNVTAESLSAGGNKVRYFEGTPITTSVILAAASVGYFVAAHALPGGQVQLLGAAWHPFSVAFAVMGCLMISKTLRIPKP